MAVHKLYIKIKYHWCVLLRHYHVTKKSVCTPFRSSADDCPRYQLVITFIMSHTYTDDQYSQSEYQYTSDVLTQTMIT